MDYHPLHHHSCRFDPSNLIPPGFKKITIEHDRVGSFSNLNGAQGFIHSQLAGAIDGIAQNQIFDS